MVLFKSSVVVGLGGALPREVNKLILQFLGIPKKKTAEELKTIIEESLRDGEEPENYMKDLLNFYFDEKFGLDQHLRTQHRKFKKTGKKPPERAAEYIRKMFNKELNKDTTEEQRTMIKAKFERQPVRYRPYLRYNRKRFNPPGSISNVLRLKRLRPITVQRSMARYLVDLSHAAHSGTPVPAQPHTPIWGVACPISLRSPASALSNRDRYHGY